MRTPFTLTRAWLSTLDGAQPLKRNIEEIAKNISEGFHLTAWTDADAVSKVFRAHSFPFPIDWGPPLFSRGQL